MSDGFYNARLRRGDMAPTEKLFQVSWSLLFWVCCIFAFGFAMLYSAGGGSFEPYAMSHLMRLLAGLACVRVAASIDASVFRFIEHLSKALIACRSEMNPMPSKRDGVSTFLLFDR